MTDTPVIQNTAQFEYTDSSGTHFIQSQTVSVNYIGKTTLMKQIDDGIDNTNCPLEYAVPIAYRITLDAAIIPPDPSTSTLIITDSLFSSTDLMTLSAIQLSVNDSEPIPITSNPENSSLTIAGYPITLLKYGENNTLTLLLYVTHHQASTQPISFLLPISAIFKLPSSDIPLPLSLKGSGAIYFGVLKITFTTQTSLAYQYYDEPITYAFELLNTSSTSTVEILPQQLTLPLPENATFSGWLQSYDFITLDGRLIYNADKITILPLDKIIVSFQSKFMR